MQSHITIAIADMGIYFRTATNRFYAGKTHTCSNWYDIFIFEAVVERVVKLLGMDSNQVVTNSKNKQAVRARSLVCYWAFNELGMNQTELAQKFGISQPAVSSAVRKGEKTVRTGGYELLEDIKL